MAVRTVEEIMTSVRERLGDDTSDEALAFIEDVNDTLSDFQTRTTDSTNWQQRYEDNDREWRDRYRNRFFNPTGSEDDEDLGDNDNHETPRTFADLFK